jgi:chemotaxis protein CheD
MSVLTVGIADCQVSRDPESVIITHALGSCIAVSIYDPIARVGGLLHFMLPESSLDREKARKRPFMFADTGIPALFNAAYAAGAEKKRLIVRVIGGAQVLDSQGVFNIGKRNYLACKKILWSAGVLIDAEEVGGSASRTVRLDLANGKVHWHGSADLDRELVPKGAKACRSGC